jgi:lactate dehydrogenase-like 2-hydroxyacid dehydrogenase
VLCDAQVLLYVSPQDVIKDENMSQLESQKLLPKAIISTGTGMDHIQISDSLKDQLGLVINSMPYRSRYHTVLVTLSLLNEIYGTELSAQHISIVGMGIIGQ